MIRWGALALAALGCSSPSSPGVDPPRDAATEASSDGGTDVAQEVAPEVCTVCSTEYSGDPPPKDWHCVKSVEARVVELDGRPIERATIMACSKGRCTNGDTDASGKVKVVPCAYMKEPSFKLVGFDKFAQFSVPLRNPKDAWFFPDVAAVRLPSSGAKFQVGAAHEVVSSDVRVGVPAGAKNVQVDPFAPYDDFRAAFYPRDKTPPGLDDGLDFEVLWALGPQNTVFDPPARISVPNTKKWPAGTEVEFHLHNVDDVSVPVPFGGWWKAANGRVTEDGARVESAPGEGIHRLTLLGIRKKS